MYIYIHMFTYLYIFRYIHAAHMAIEFRPAPLEFRVKWLSAWCRILSLMPYYYMLLVIFPMDGMHEHQ